MNLQNILLSPWAIKQDRLEHFRTILDAHLRGPKLSLKDMEAKILSSDLGMTRNYEVRDGVAIIPVVGPIAKNPDIFDRVVLGMVSSSRIKDDFLKAIADSRVKAVLLYVDSPGGTVDGTQELAQAVYDSRGGKRIVTFSDGLIASAGYWIGSAADEVYISGPTVEAGSIGVYWAHAEYSEMNRRAGVVITEITAGKYKAFGSKNKPLGDEAREYFQDQIDYLYSIFIDKVSLFRGVSVEETLKMADGKVYIGQQAIEAGLVDGISTMDELLSGFGSGGVRAVANIPVKSGFQSAPGEGRDGRGEREQSIEEASMKDLTIETLKKDREDLYTKIFDLGKDAVREEFEKKLDDARNAAAKAERERIQAVEAQTLPGHEKLIKEMMYDGKTTGDQAAARIVQAQREMGAGKLDSLKGDKKGINVPITNPPKDGDDDDGASAVEQFDAKVKAYQGENKCSRADAVRAVAKADPDLHKRYIQEINEKK